jgi:PKD repeat protein
VAPPPNPNFYYSPADPSSFDNIQFEDYSTDPANLGISSWAWDFGDGATSALEFPTHRYTADGTYPLRLTVTTTDGRTASISKSVLVETHDVAITRLAVPNSAHVGQTIAVSVYLQNTRYPETVGVLSKSIPVASLRWACSPSGCR